MVYFMNLLSLEREMPDWKTLNECTLGDDSVLKELGLKVMLTKKDFKDSGHLKSGRYFLPKMSLLTEEGNKSGLLKKLAVKASTDPCGASYQRCYSETPMIRCRSKGIEDFS